LGEHALLKLGLCIDLRGDAQPLEHASEMNAAGVARGRIGVGDRSGGEQRALERFAVVTSSTPTRRALLATGRFLTIIPAPVLRLAAEKPAPRALPIELPKTPRPIGIVTLKARTLTPLAQRFIDCARDVARTLAAERGGYDVRSRGPKRGKTS
jgi:DNA-binding transcriptional LysR family regulator